MPYKDKEKARVQGRLNMRKWRSNPDNAAKIKAQRKEAYWANKNGLRDKIKAYHESNKEHLIQKQIQWQSLHPDAKKISQKKNNHKKRAKAKIGRDNLISGYVVDLIHREFGLDKKTIRNNPELIENKLIILKTKRLIKQKKDGSSKTS